MNLAIIGGGIGGLTAAVALHRIGIDAHVYERAPELNEVGAGITLWSNAVAGLDRIGLADAVIRRAAVLETMHTLSPGGKRIDSQSLVRVSAASGAPSICVHRASLQQTLAAALPPDRLHLGFEVANLREEKTGVAIRFVDGRQRKADAVIAADGIRSVVRATLFGWEEPRYAGYWCIRGLAPLGNLSPTEATFMMAPGGQLGFFPCGEGRLYWFVCWYATERPEDPLASGLAFLGRHLPRLPEHHRRAVEATGSDRIIAGPIHDRPPRREWGRGRITLLGDAIHPTTPNLGQGACLAIEDGIVIADLLARSSGPAGNDPAAGSPARAFRAYEECRRRRAASIARQSWRLGRIYQLKSPPLVALRTLAFRFPLAGTIARESLRRLLNYELPMLDRRGGVEKDERPDQPTEQGVR